MNSQNRAFKEKQVLFIVHYFQNKDLIMRNDISGALFAVA